MKQFARLVVIITALAIGLLGMQAPVQADVVTDKPVLVSEPVLEQGFAEHQLGDGVSIEYEGVSKQDSTNVSVDWGWTNATVWYNKTETNRIVAANGACSVIIGKVPGPIAKILSGSCGVIAVWAGYARSQNKCVGVKIAYLMAYPYGWDTRRC